MDQYADIADDESLEETLSRLAPPSRLESINRGRPVEGRPAPPPKQSHDGPWGEPTDDL
jgi:hypothetical protein